ncbi:hypothetical protein IWQ61_009306, partial [Dispira simplex]
WFTLLNHTPQSQLRWFTTTPTPVHIIEGVSHAFLQMLAVYPRVERLVEHMAQALETMLTTSDPFLQETKLPLSDDYQKYHDHVAHTAPPDAVVRPVHRYHSARDSLAPSRSTSALPLLAPASFHPGSTRPQIYHFPRDGTSSTAEANSNNNSNNENDHRPLQNVPLTTESSESTALSGTIHTRFLIHRRRLDMVAALGTVPKTDVPRR